MLFEHTAVKLIFELDCHLFLVTVELIRNCSSTCWSIHIDKKYNNFLWFFPPQLNSYLIFHFSQENVPPGKYFASEGFASLTQVVCFLYP